MYRQSQTVPCCHLWLKPSYTLCDGDYAALHLITLTPWSQRRSRTSGKSSKQLNRTSMSWQMLRYVLTRGGLEVEFGSCVHRMVPGNGSWQLQAELTILGVEPAMNHHP